MIVISIYVEFWQALIAIQSDFIINVTDLQKPDIIAYHFNTDFEKYHLTLKY